MILEKKRKNHAKLNAIAEDFKKLIYFQEFLIFGKPFFPNKPHMQTFLMLQSKWAPEEELFLNNNSAFRVQINTKVIQLIPKNSNYNVKCATAMVYRYIYIKNVRGIAEYVCLVSEWIFL